MNQSINKHDDMDLNKNRREERKLFRLTYDADDNTGDDDDFDDDI